MGAGSSAQRKSSDDRPAEEEEELVLNGASVTIACTDPVG